MQNIIELVGEIDNYSFRRVLSEIRGIIEKSDEKREVIVLINSSGGNVNEALAIIDLLEMIPNPITTINIGRADSCSGIIFIHGNERLMAKHAQFQFHTLSTTFEKMAIPTVDIVTHASNIQRLSRITQDFLLEKTKIPVDLIESSLRSQSGTTLFLKECLEYGIATGVFDASKLSLLK